MATMYPAVQATMGRWTYYIVKMKASDLAKEVELSSDVHQDKTLDDAIQRGVNRSRAKQDLVVYLHDREDHFFNSIVVAALGGSPTFTALRLADTPENQVFKAMEIDQSFGVLTFKGGERYYALDGQHRLAAIKAILDPSDKPEDKFAKNYVSEEFRQQFRNEELSVIMVVQDPGQNDEFRDEVLKDYRRLFSSLNRYAKPTDEATNIIMDENDGIAILTRRLISEHEFFKWTVDRPNEYFIIKTATGKNLREGDPFFTQIEVFYNMNLVFLSSALRGSQGWKLSKNESVPEKSWKRIWAINRPDEETLDEFYEELSTIWDGILKVLPELRNPPTEMRVHNPQSNSDGPSLGDSALFWPIGQEVFAPVVRGLLDDYSNRKNLDALDSKQVVEALAPLSRVNWSLHEPPWRRLLLVESADKAGNLSWSMRNEGRTQAKSMAREVLEFIVGVSPLDAEGQESLKDRWAQLLVPLPDPADVESLWRAVLEQASA